MLILLHSDRIFYASTGSLNRYSYAVEKVQLDQTYHIHVFLFDFLISSTFPVWLFDLMALTLVYLQADFCLILKFFP